MINICIQLLLIFAVIIVAFIILGIIVLCLCGIACALDAHKMKVREKIKKELQNK